MNSEFNLTFFPTELDFREWLEKNHATASELYVGYYKVSSRKQSMTWSQSVDQAICFGWIDGLRKSVDNESYFIRFTPRNPRSNWSAVNIKKVEDLLKQGLMKPAGLALFNRRETNRSIIYSYENVDIQLSSEHEAQFKANKKAWDFFITMPFSYRKPAIYWVMSAKQEITRLKRLAELITDSDARRKIKPLNY